MPFLLSEELLGTNLPHWRDLHSGTAAQDHLLVPPASQQPTGPQSQPAERQ